MMGMQEIGLLNKLKGVYVVVLVVIAECLRLYISCWW